MRPRRPCRSSRRTRSRTCSCSSEGRARGAALVARQRDVEWLRAAEPRRVELEAERGGVDEEGRERAEVAVVEHADVGGCAELACFGEHVDLAPRMRAIAAVVEGRVAVR